MPGGPDGATQELLRRLIMAEQQRQAAPRRIVEQPAPAPVANVAPVSPTPVQQPMPQPIVNVAPPGPIRIPQDPGQPVPTTTAPAMSSTEYANRGVEQIEGVAKVMPTPDYSQATVRPELGIDYLNRTGQQRPEGQTPASVTSGVRYQDRAQEMRPPVRIPSLGDAAVSDSTVQPPMLAGPGIDVGPKRINPGVEEVPRLEGESDAAYAARKHRAFSQALRNESPDSKVKETPTGIDVDAPQKRRGIKGRGIAALLLALGNMQGNTPAQNAGSAIVNLLTGAIDPDFERQIERTNQVRSADAGSKVLDEQEQRDYIAAERKARTEQINDYPRRQADAEKDKRWDRRQQQMRLLASSPEGFDPQRNAEHKKLQLEALADGQMLPAIPPKTARTSQAPHTSTRSVTAGEYPGVKRGTKIRQIWNGQGFEDELQNGRPVISAEAPEKTPKAVTPDLRDDLRSQIQSLDSDIASSQTEWDRHSKDVQTKDRWIQSEAARRKTKAQTDDPTGVTLEGKRSLKEWIDMLRANDPDVAGGAYDDSVTSRDWLARDLTEKKAMAKQLRTQLEQEDRRARVAPGAGKTYTTADVQAWAKARGIKVGRARRMLEKEGATIE